VKSGEARRTDGGIKGLDWVISHDWVLKLGKFNSEKWGPACRKLDGAKTN